MAIDFLRLPCRFARPLCSGLQDVFPWSWRFACAPSRGFPVTPQHTPVIPKRHVADYFQLEEEELAAIQILLKIIRGKILETDRQVEGFNIGWNVGEVAGQTIFHAHVHLIPRRPDDVENPRGGIRHLIPGKGFY